MIVHAVVKCNSFGSAFRNMHENIEELLRRRQRWTCHNRNKFCQNPLHVVINLLACLHINCEIAPRQHQKMANRQIDRQTEKTIANKFIKDAKPLNLESQNSGVRKHRLLLIDITKNFLGSKNCLGVIKKKLYLTQIEGIAQANEGFMTWFKLKQIG